MEPTAYDHRQTNHLADDRATAAVGKRLFHVGSNIFFFVAFDKDDPPGMKASLGERGKEQIRAREAPDDRPLRTSGNPGGKKCCGCTIDGSGTTTREFVECSMGQTAARKDRVDLLDTECKTARLLRALPLNGRDTFAQISEHLIADSRHWSRILSKSQ